MFFLALRANKGFLASVTFLILAGSSATLIVASACDISSYKTQKTNKFAFFGCSNSTLSHTHPP